MTGVQTCALPILLASAAKTGRCVIVHEAPLTGGVGAEIAARIAERGLVSLLAPIERVAGWDTVMPCRASSSNTCRAKPASSPPPAACWHTNELPKLPPNVIPGRGHRPRTRKP